MRYSAQTRAGYPNRTLLGAVPYPVVSVNIEDGKSMT
jgi:hypothetical protein